MKRLVKAVLAQTPYRIVRDRGVNRFQAIETTLRGMRDRGFTPRVIIDGGAHLGTFSLETKAIFPAAIYHLIEPQSACLTPLRQLCKDEGFILYEVALAEYVGEIGFTRSEEPNTGAQIWFGGELPTDRVLTSTLDELFARQISKDDRALLKMDLQGYELYALRGATNLLPRIEAILVEVGFRSYSYEPSIAELVAFLAEHGFQLYDVASLCGRRRDNRLVGADFVFVRTGTHLLEDSSWE